MEFDYGQDYLEFLTIFVDTIPYLNSLMARSTLLCNSRF